MLNRKIQTNHSVCCSLQTPCGLWYLQWQATAPNALMNRANTSLYPAQNTTEQNSPAPQGFLSAALWPLQQLSTEFRQAESAQQHGENLGKGKLEMLL